MGLMTCRGTAGARPAGGQPRPADHPAQV